jgi:hypothetical protein
VDPRRLPPEVLLLVAAAALGFALLQTLRLALRSWRARRRVVAAAERGAWGEARAEDLLRRQGLRVVGRQVAVRYECTVDDDPVSVALRADYVVAEGEDRYVAEVKTGELAPRIETAATRRQLLEYCVAFRALDVKGVLLVDAENDRVHRVEFPLVAGRAPREGRSVAWLLAGVAAGALALLVARSI